MYKVFIYNKPIYFLEKEKIPNNVNPKEIFPCQNEEDKEAILNIHKRNSVDKRIFVVHKNTEKLMDLFFNGYKTIEAAGGLVLNDQNQILFIKRLGLWDLPKGKVEKNEALKVAAVREVEEECGLESPVIESKLLESYHTYATKGRNYLKITHWYLMNRTCNADLVPQQEEGITEVIWKDASDIQEQRDDTYGSIIDVLDAYLD